MEVYILDTLLRRTTVVDRFESLIWTERYSAAGDFELVLASTSANRSLFPTGTWIVVNESDRIMIVETLELTEDNDGRELLKISGTSIETILSDRSTRLTLTSLTAVPKLTYTGLPATVMNLLFTERCVGPSTDFLGDKLPFYTAGTKYPADSIPLPATSTTFDVEPDTLYNWMKKVADTYNLGFRLYRYLDTGALYFNVYTGTDRTSSQTVRPAVIFAPELDNLSNTSELTSTAIYKNVAYVIGQSGAMIVYADNTPSSISGFERRVLTVKADDITTTDPTALAVALQQRGREELAKCRSVYAFDGEISQNGKYKYNFDYRLGDLVETRNADGFTSRMRVTEQIFVSDSMGDRSYPTLSVDLLIDPGTWLSWDGQATWDTALGVWDDL